MLLFALLLTLSPLFSCETIQEVDSLIIVQHHVNLYRIKEHILAWGEDRGVGVFRSEVMNPLMSHLTVEVAMLASTLMEHVHLENVDKAVPSTPTQSANIEPVSTVDSSNGGRNGIQRVQRNIFGDIVSTITGMPTGEQYQHHMHVQEEIRKKLIHMAKHQVEAEQNMMRSVSELMTAEEQMAVRMTNLERLVEMQGTATARFFAYYHLLCEDRDMLEDTLEAVRGGFASTRLDVYLSRLAGLHTMGMFEYNQILQTRGGFDVLYFARAYRQVEVRDYFLTNESAVLLTDERKYLMQPDGLPAYTHVLTEFEVRKTGESCDACAELYHLKGGIYYVYKAGNVTCTGLNKSTTFVLTLHQTFIARAYYGCANAAVSFGRRGLRIRQYSVRSDGDKADSMLTKRLYNRTSTLSAAVSRSVELQKSAALHRDLTKARLDLEETREIEEENTEYSNSTDSEHFIMLVTVLVILGILLLLVLRRFLVSVRAAKRVAAAAVEEGEA